MRIEPFLFIYLSAETASRNTHFTASYKEFLTTILKGRAHVISSAISLNHQKTFFLWRVHHLSQNLEERWQWLLASYWCAPGGTTTSESEYAPAESHHLARFRIVASETQRPPRLPHLKSTRQSKNTEKVRVSLVHERLSCSLQKQFFTELKFAPQSRGPSLGVFFAR
jgi:hypothetical protein